MNLFDSLFLRIETYVTITINGEPRSVEGSITLASLLNDLQIGPRHVAVEVNLEIVPRTRHDEFSLHEGDQVEVVTLVGGG